MKLELIRLVKSGSSESWRWLALFSVVEGTSPKEAGCAGVDRDDWEREVFRAAEECSIHINDIGSGTPGTRFANPPLIEWWERSAPVPVGSPPHLTIEQSGGLDI